MHVPPARDDYAHAPLRIPKAFVQPIRQPRSIADAFNYHTRAASAANAGGFLQTSLSKVTRHRTSRRYPTLSCRVTPDRVIALPRTYAAIGAVTAYQSPRCGEAAGTGPHLVG